MVIPALRNLALTTRESRDSERGSLWTKMHVFIFMFHHIYFCFMFRINVYFQLDKEGIGTALMEIQYRERMKREKK